MKNSIPIIAILLWICTSCEQRSPMAVMIATSANMQQPMQQLIDKFTATSGIPCKLIMGSSGKLTAQILEGAPYDILVSADMYYPTQLFDQGYSSAKPRIYAYGHLILLGQGTLAQHIERLYDPQARHVAVANPKTAPYGTAALEVLDYYSMLPDIRSKLVYGESIAQVNHFLTSGAAEVGITAASAHFADTSLTWSVIPTGSYTPIAQGALMIDKKKITPETIQFYSFLFSSEASEILNNFGYSTPEP